MTPSRRLGIVTVSALIPLGLGVGAAQAVPTTSTRSCEQGLTTALLTGGRDEDIIDASAPPCRGRLVPAEPRQAVPTTSAQAFIEDPQGALEEAGLGEISD